ncbi:rod shape-determining protein [Sneathia sp. DSM 16631]|nr:MULTISPECIES: rod shape-determining protein [Sneathia]MBE2989510.1 rod shape-determining protein [Sneathia sp. DSM 16630]MBE3030485.1 rod shape-determining protein [Sneathia sp. DSM 16631]
MSIRKFFRMLRIKKSISIDLGTANVLIYDRQREKIVLNEPSVVALDKKTRKVIAVGHDAREMLGKTPDSILAIKPLKDGVIADLDVTKEMLNYFITKIYGHAIFKPEVMICVPLEVTSVERKALFDSVIGAKKIYIIEEGRAAIIGSGIDISRPSGHMVVDIGGGSTDIAILSLNEVIASRSIRIAGNTFDNDIVRYIKNKYSLQIGERAAENIKKNLATALPKENPKKMPVKGLNIDLGTPESLEISENEIYEAMKNSLYAIVNTAKEVLEKCPPELAADLLENGIVMTGGGALIKGFADLIASEVRVKVFVSKSPLDAVVLGGGYAFDNQKLIKTLQVKEN